MNPRPTPERVRDVLNYDPNTGILRWRVATGKKARPGKVVGCTDGHRRVLVGIDGYRTRAHILVWVWVHGEWPSMMIDHINGDPSDNRLCNLRLATPSQNQANRRRRCDNCSGLKGVHLHRQTGKWRAQIRVGGRSQHIGLFVSKEEAHAAYMGAATKLFGEFAFGGAR